MKSRFFLIAMALCAAAAAGCNLQQSAPEGGKVVAMNLSKYDSSKPERMMRVLFIHHSCGGQWLADRGVAKEILPGSCILESHPNGGGLRTELRQNNYQVHEAAYGSPIGEKTDIGDWNRKFRDQMNGILVCDQQERSYTGSSEKNDIVVFKSCFPNSWMEAEGKEPGDPDAAARTTANYKAAYRSLLAYFRAHPDTLFVAVTAPPLAETPPSRALEAIRRMIGSGTSYQAVGMRVRRFNDWLKDTGNGWLSGYELKNVVVFDYYDILTGHGRSNYSLYPTKGGRDSHPSAEGNSAATVEFVTFLNRAVDRLGSVR